MIPLDLDVSVPSDLKHYAAHVVAAAARRNRGAGKKEIKASLASLREHAESLDPYPKELMASTVARALVESFHVFSATSCDNCIEFMKRQVCPLSRAVACVEEKYGLALGGDSPSGDTDDFESEVAQALARGHICNAQKKCPSYLLNEGMFNLWSASVKPMCRELSVEFGFSYAAVYGYIDQIMNKITLEVFGDEEADCGWSDDFFHGSGGGVQSSLFH